MQKLNREQFNEVKTKLKNSKNNETEILVGLGSCGIAAGSKKTFDAFVEEINAKGLTSILVKRTGCMGLCETEPTVEVKVPGMPAIIYGMVTPEIARKIIENHIIRKTIVDNLIQDRPSSDILEGGIN
jgi:NADP-reducing hydrogenase subunit HndB